MSDSNTDDVLESTSLGRAFKRLLADKDFLESVIDDPESATAEYELSAEDREALVSDAEALEGEVGAFGFKARGGRIRGPEDLIANMGGLLTPIRLGLQPQVGVGWMISKI